MKYMPCMDCTKRYLGCHDKCDKYQATKKVPDKDSYDIEEYFRCKRLSMNRRFKWKRRR